MSQLRADALLKRNWTAQAQLVGSDVKCIAHTRSRIVSSCKSSFAVCLSYRHPTSKCVCGRRTRSGSPGRLSTVNRCKYAPAASAHVTLRNACSLHSCYCAQRRLSAYSIDIITTSEDARGRSYSPFLWPFVLPMQSMDPTYPLFPVFAFLGFILALVPLPWHFQAWNAGTCIYMVWASLASLIQFVDSIIWRGNIINSAPVWCDICE